MARERALIAGMTDYTGVDLSDILVHLEEWRSFLEDSVAVLGNIRERLAAAGPDPRIPDGLHTIDAFVDLFRRYISDLTRLTKEMPQGVRARHVETVRQLYESVAMEEGHCVAFKRHYHLDALSGRDKVQEIFAEVYRLTRDDLINMKDLSNLAPRLKALEAAPHDPSPPNTGAFNALELKPNFFGLGVNLNWIIARWRRRNP